MTRPAPSSFATLCSDDWPISPPRGPRTAFGRLPSQPSISTSTSASTSSKPAPSAKPAAPSDTTNPKKRVMPWDNIDVSSYSKPSTSKAGSASASSSSNFLSLASSSSSTANKKAKTGLLTSESLNIKQKVILSPEQQKVLSMVVDQGKSIFFTGSAGTGKSVLLREIITSLKRKYSTRPDSVAVTASTGMAACNIGGTTIHSFSGIGLGKEDAEFLINKVKKNKVAQGKWSKTQVLIIDEVSMVDGILFDKLAAIACALKKSPTKPFGGIQLVVTGDFFQLPPVTKGTASFAFEAKAWKTAIKDTVNLTQVFRQTSTEFIDMLNEMRFGNLSATSIDKFKSLSRIPKYDDGVDPTELFPRREDVERSNQARLNALPGTPTIFRSEDWPHEEPGKVNTYLSNFMAPEKVVLKIGAQVMLIKNLDAVLVNGTVGKVVGFGVAALQDDDEDITDEIKDEREVEERQKRKQKIIEQIKAGKIEESPIIEWRTPNGIEKRVMVREEFKVEDNLGKKLASRKQYPIILAWAMSIHKSQGQTLPRVKVDLRKVFEKGQSYVALSRATCLDGLQVLGFDPKKVEAHPKVIQWSKTLKTLD